jgi:hypothetical protein
MTTLAQFGFALLMIGGAGALGELVNCAISGEFHLPEYDANARIFRPGWIGNIIMGIVAAIVVWGGYGGPGSTVAIFANSNDPLDLKTGQVIISIVIGIGGGKILSSLAQQQAERVAREKLADTLQQIIKER